METPTGNNVPIPSLFGKPQNVGRFSNESQPSDTPNRLMAMAMNQSGNQRDNSNRNFHNDRSVNANAPRNMPSNNFSMSFLDRQETESTSRSGPPPLMSLQPNIGETDIKSKEGLPNNFRNERDRPVERIPRDRDVSTDLFLLTCTIQIFRLLIKSNSYPTQRPGDASKDAGNANQKKSAPLPKMSDRVARDPHPQEDKQPDKNPFTLDEVTWEANSSSNANPFELPNKRFERNNQAASRKNANPFESQPNPFSNLGGNPWGTKSNEDQRPSKLPTLSDFLNKDDCKVTDDYLNRRGFGTNPAEKNRKRPPTPEMSGPRFEFTATSKLLPLVVGSRHKTPSPPPHAQPESTVAETNEWFTRDRGGAFEEDEYINDEEDPYQESDYTPAVIDYGHGGGTGTRNTEEDEYDLPRCERPVEYQGDEDYPGDFDDVPSNAVTIDYGHGSAAPQVPVGITAVPIHPYGQNGTLTRTSLSPEMDFNNTIRFDFIRFL